MAERDTHQHGDLFVITERLNDGTIRVILHPGHETVNVETRKA